MGDIGLGYDMRRGTGGPDSHRKEENHNQRSNNQKPLLFPEKVADRLIAKI